MSFLRVFTGTCVVASMVTACNRQQPAADEHMSHMSAGDLAAPAPEPPARRRATSSFPRATTTQPPASRRARAMRSG